MSLTAWDQNVSLRNCVLASCICTPALWGSCCGQSQLVLFLQGCSVALTCCHYWWVLGWFIFLFLKVTFLGTGKTGKFLYTVKHADCSKNRWKVSLFPLDWGRPVWRVLSISAAVHNCNTENESLKTRVFSALFPSHPHCSLSYLCGL